MGTAGISISSQSSRAYGYTDHTNDYIPNTKRWDEENICEFIPDKSEDKTTCCSSVDTLDRAIDKAYRHGIQSHLGVNAIQGYPCVTDSEMSKLSNDLNKKIQRYKIEPEIHKDIDPDERPLQASKDVLNYCREVVFEKLARELGRVSDSKPIAFTKQVLKYCQYVLTLRPGDLDPSTYLNKGWDSNSPF